MTVALGALAGAPASAMRVTIPAWGRWWADVTLTEPLELAEGASVALAIADVTAACAVVSGGAVHGRAAYRVVGGRGGWGKTLPRKPYRNDLGVARGLILRDVASEAGEDIADLPNTKLGGHYARAEGPAYETLNALAPQNWHVDFEGITRIGRRPAVEYRGAAARTRVDTGAEVIELAIDSTLAGLVPGAIVDGRAPAVDVEYLLDADRLTARVYSGRTLERRFAAYAAIMRALDPWAAYRVPREFRVTTQDGERVNLQPVRVSSGMPDLKGVQIRPGVPGIRADVKLGEIVMVFFTDGDPSRPYVGHHDAADAPGYFPAELDLGKKSGAKAIVVDGDTVDLSLVTFGGNNAVGTATVSASLTKIKAGE